MCVKVALFCFAVSLSWRLLVLPLEERMNSYPLVFSMPLLTLYASIMFPHLSLVCVGGVGSEEVLTLLFLPVSTGHL